MEEYPKYNLPFQEKAVQLVSSTKLRDVTAIK